MSIQRTTHLFILLITMGLGLGSVAQAEMTLQMAAANNPCAMKDGHNPCAMKHSNPCNPCGMKHSNPCNPCGMKHHNPCNPCGMKHSNPCGMKNPCGASANPCALKNPCSAKAALGDQFVDPKVYVRPEGTKLYTKSFFGKKKLIEEGEHLFNDTSLGSNNLSCNNCHSTDDLFNKSFATPYPHKVKMTTDRSGYNKPVSADEFVQFCIATPLAGKPLPWESRELGALTAYVKEVKQKNFMKTVQANPCHFKGKMAGNPCNPCAMKNPCATQNPCAAKNPCNPCATKNPCSKW
ncbi:c-type cytochrome [Pseudomonadota bacterium]